MVNVLWCASFRSSSILQIEQEYGLIRGKHFWVELDVCASHNHVWPTEWEKSYEVSNSWRGYGWYICVRLIGIIHFMVQMISNDTKSVRQVLCVQIQQGCFKLLLWRVWYYISTPRYVDIQYVHFESWSMLSRQTGHHLELLYSQVLPRSILCVDRKGVTWDSLFVHRSFCGICCVSFGIPQAGTYVIFFSLLTDYGR